MLPEYLVHKIGLLSELQKSTDGSTNTTQPHHCRPHRSGKELWDFLRPRLGILVRMQRQWGGVQDIYGQQARASLFESQHIPEGIYDPDGSYIAYWEIMQVLALFYIIFVVSPV